MSAGTGDFERALGGLLAANVFEVDVEALRLAEQLSGIDLHARNAVAGIDVMNYIEQRLDGIDLNSFDHGRFPRIDFRHDHPFDLRAARFNRDRQCAPDSPQTPIER